VEICKTESVITITEQRTSFTLFLQVPLLQHKFYFQGKVEVKDKYEIIINVVHMHCEWVAQLV